MRCRCCNRILTNPISIAVEIGPICRMRNQVREYKNNQLNMFGNRAQYEWGVDGEVLWLRDIGTDGKSLTNDIDACLTEIAANLPDPLTGYRIMYCDSEGVWDAVKLGPSNHVQFISIGVCNYDNAIARLRLDKKYDHEYTVLEKS